MTSYRRSLGGQEVGSIWGHGAYVAPVWTADWLHGLLICLRALRPGAAWRERPMAISFWAIDGGPQAASRPGRAAGAGPPRSRK